MFKKSGFVSLNKFCLLSFVLIMSAVFILGMGITPAQAAKKADTQKSISGLVDINSASQKELEDVKGVGPATAKKIIAGRPYKSVDELSKAGVSAKAVDSMKPFVTVGKAQTAPVAAAATKATTAVKEKKSEATKGVAVGLVDINNASQKELEALKGVGPASAKKIIAGRPYKSVDELSKAGLNAKAVDSIKPFVTVGGAQSAPVAAAATKATAAKTSAAATTTAASSEVTKSAKNVQTTAKSAAAKLAPGTKININNADQSTIEKLPEIGPVKAKAIIDVRPYNSIEDVMKVKGIKGKTFDAIKDYIVVR
ncbi:MAG: helix-hairpin-helix domain-containing protein [Deltaproteobacteria bacterium]|nr:helix-hairpin-helix domain-containing protein [Deltaproteobacteria bacterium]